MSGLRDYLKSKGARTLTEENCPALADYRRKMREEVIPAIERDIRAQHRAAHFLRLGIPDPLASGMSAFGQDAQRLEAQPASPVGNAGTPGSRSSRESSQ